jgi:hypothetical protein
VHKLSHQSRAGKQVTPAIGCYTFQANGIPAYGELDISGGSVRSRAKIRQNHNGWYLMDVEESLHLVGWRET